MCSYINIYSKWIYFIREDPFVNKNKFWSSQFSTTTSALFTMSERVSSSCFFLTCLLKFLLAENLLSHSSQDTTTCVVLCFWSLSWLGKDFGFVAHLPRVHINIPVSSVLCINLMWFTKYSLTIVLYGHSSQWYCWLLIWFALWTFSWIKSLFSVWQILPHSLHDQTFPIFSSWTVFMCLITEPNASFFEQVLQSTFHVDVILLLWHISYWWTYFSPVSTFTFENWKWIQKVVYSDLECFKSIHTNLIMSVWF